MTFARLPRRESFDRSAFNEKLVSIGLRELAL